MAKPDPRRRNTMLMAASFVGIAAFGVLLPRGAESPFAWRWDEVEIEPFSDVARAGADERVAVRVLESSSGDNADAAWVAELLWSTGLLGVRTGPPATHADAEAELWLLPASGCEHSGAVLRHIEAGGALLVAEPCEELRDGLSLPAPLAWVDMPGAFLRWGDFMLPLPSAGAEWPSEGVDSAPTPWRGSALRERGALPAVARDEPAPVLALGFDLFGFLRELRQGEPRFAGLDRDGIHGPKPNDLRPFPWTEPIWHQPSADLWVEVLVAWIERALDGGPGRIWPFPGPELSALVLTSDQDFVDTDWLDPLFARVERHGGEMTSLLTAFTRQSNGAPFDEVAGAFPAAGVVSRAQRWGHGFGAHPNPVGASEPAQLERIVRLQRTALDEALAGLPPRVSRHHYLLWWGYDAPMRLHEELGTWMELSFVSLEPRFLGPGFLFGGARPLRYQASDGRLLAVMAQPTHIEDDVLVGDFPYSARLSSADAVLSSAGLLQRAIAHRVPLVANVHPLLAVSDDGELLDGLLIAASKRGVPVMSAERWATWSWLRLALASQAAVDLPGGGESVGGGLLPKVPSQLPIRLWRPGTRCAEPIAASAVSGPGCLEDWQTVF